MLRIRDHRTPPPPPVDHQTPPARNYILTPSGREEPPGRNRQKSVVPIIFGRKKTCRLYLEWTRKHKWWKLQFTKLAKWYTTYSRKEETAPSSECTRHEPTPPGPAFAGVVLTRRKTASSGHFFSPTLSHSTPCLRHFDWRPLLAQTLGRSRQNQVLTGIRVRGKHASSTTINKSSSCFHMGIVAVPLAAKHFTQERKCFRLPARRLTATASGSHPPSVLS